MFDWPVSAGDRSGLVQGLTSAVQGHSPRPSLFDIIVCRIAAGQGWRDQEETVAFPDRQEKHWRILDLQHQALLRSAEVS